MEIFSSPEMLMLMISGTASVAIAIFIFSHGNHGLTARLFVGLNIVMASWLIVMYISNHTTSPTSTLWWARGSLFLAIPLNALLLLFSMSVQSRHFPLKARPLKLFLGITAATMILVLTPLTFRLAPDLVMGNKIVTGPGMALFGILTAVMNGATIVVLSWKLRYSKVGERKQLLMVLFGVLIMYGAITATIFLPMAFFGDSTNIWLAPLCILAFTMLTGYAIFRHGLLNLKVVMAEMLSVVLVFVYGFQLVLPDSEVGYWLKIGVYAIIGILVLSLLRSTHNEQKQFAELQEMAGKLQLANSQLREMDEMKTEFISMASHQLRTPVSVIKGYLSLMSDGAYGKLPSAALEKIAQMSTYNEHLVQLINNTLNMSRIEQGRLEFHCGPTDLAALARECVSELEIKARDKGLELTCEVADEALPPAWADSDKSHEVIANLLDNAIKYTASGSVKISLAKERRGTEDFVAVSVSDTGMGIAKPAQKRLFEKFYRVNEPNAPRVAGTGLGLYICRKFIENMGGSIGVASSRPGKGTTFRFVLPARPKGECNLVT